MKVILVGLIIALSGIAVLSATLRVPSEYATIQEAIDAARSGDVILIAPGTYTGDVTIRDKSGITLKGDVEISIPEGVPCYEAIQETVSSVVLNGTLYIIDSDNIVVEALTVTGPGVGVYIQGRTIDPAETVTIRYCNLVRNARSGVRAVGTYRDLNISCSNISYNGWDGIYLADWGTGITIENNAINYNGQTTPRGVGIRVGGYVKDLAIRGNVIQGNPFAGIHPG